MSESTKKFHQYFSSRPSLTIVMENGNRIRFVGGVYMTDNEQEISFLNEQIRCGHQMIYVKEGQKIVDADALDPLAAVKKRAVEEYIAQQKLAADPSRDMGNSVSDLTASIQTSKTIQAISVGSIKK